LSDLTSLAIKHLLLKLRPLNRALDAAVERQRQSAARLIRPDVTPLCVTTDQVKTLLGDVDQLAARACPAEELGWFTTEEIELLSELEEKAKSEDSHLPLDRLVTELHLTRLEEEAILLCAAPELDRSYERIFAYILDDLNRRFPCIELLSSLTATSLEERLIRRAMLGRFSKLRRNGLIQQFGEAATELRQELRLSPGLFDFLATGAGDPATLFRDRAEVSAPEALHLPPDLDSATVRSLGLALAETGSAAVGIWGPRHGAQEDVAIAVASAAGKQLRRWLPINGAAPALDVEDKINEAVQTASVLGAILWVRTDSFGDPGSESTGLALAENLASSRVPVILTGIHPWRPTRLLETRPYVEIELDSPTYTARKAMWSSILPEMSDEQNSDLAARFRVNGAELRAVARVARAHAKLAGNGCASPVGDHVESACAAVVRKASFHFATVVKPRRGPDDLVLPAELHRQVLEVGHFFRAWPHVSERWGFGRLVSGTGGIKALFTGDSGTGKTLAAEVIAGSLNMPLLKVDLARVVSKWVGETEKHLETAFREAEDSHAVLFFDEADALFGKRGEVQQGVDRYANLEVSYLLQRLEDHNGLVILASNLKDNIDSAFTRRFQVVIHFPRPGYAERQRIWELAFPEAAPLDPEVDLKGLARLDLTGAGIVSASQAAAFLATAEKSATITMYHVVRSIARQYRREARILTPADLGPYSALLRETK
jgi:hypothetical protein